jgi:S-adenosylmethionine-diacylglycerol 3-amino-3-carboxypropyl transferase
MLAAPAIAPRSLIDRWHQRCFDAVYQRSLLYNACWEDPAIDRVALNLGADDVVMVITSGGCNALDYALLGPKRVHAVDANPRQTALLELKLTAIRELSHEDFFALFGDGHHPQFRRLYQQHLRSALSPFAQAFWDERQHWFSGSGWRNSFYFQGLSGLVARLVRQWIVTSPSMRKAFQALLATRDLNEQQHIYDTAVEPRLWGPAMRWAISNRSTMSLLGVPTAQMKAVAGSHEDGIAGFIRSCIRCVFRELPLWNNYFWTVYLRGHYTQDCCPEYLKPENFHALKAGLVDRIVPHTTTVTEHLNRCEEPISRFVLLDHMDWMANYAPAALSEEWQALYHRAAPGARVLFRSASPEVSFLDSILISDHHGSSPTPLMERLRFDRPLAQKLHEQDRVHTYASFHIADLVTA